MTWQLHSNKQTTSFQTPVSLHLVLVLLSHGFGHRKSMASLRTSPDFWTQTGQRQSQSSESVAPNVRVRNPIGQSQSPVNTSTGCRETKKRRQRVSNRESVTPRKPGGGSRNPEENRKLTTKSRSPWKENPGTPGKQKVNNKESVTPENYLSVCLSVCLSIYLSIN